MHIKLKTKKLFLFIIILLDCFALIAQFYLIQANNKTTFFETTIKYFGYFTILTNVMVAVCSIILFIEKKSRLYNFFSHPSVQTAITVYILIVGLVYNLFLRSYWQPQGIQKLVDELLHSVIPVSFFLYWILFVRKQPQPWKEAFVWLIYPAAYTVYTLIHGAVTKYYPYPFIDVNTIGYAKALLNGGMVLLTFLMLSLVFIAIGKANNKEF